MDSTDSSLDPTADPSDGVQSNPRSAVRPLRVWPALLILIAAWGMRFGLAMVDDPTVAVIMVRFIGPGVLCSLLLLLWWPFFSRATLKEKLLGGATLLVVAAIATALSDKTVLGFGNVVYAVPWGMTAFALVAVVLRRVYPARTIAALVAAALGFGYWDLVRIDVFNADFTIVKNWRWEPTAEEEFLKTLAEQDNNASPAAAVDDALAEPDWPAFRGPNRDSVVPVVVLNEDWEAQPPKELWRIPIGPGWSSFSVAGERLFTQQQRGENEAIVCYHAETGDELWVHEDESRFWETIGGAGPRATPTLAGNGLFTLGANGLLSRLEPTTGELVWQSDVRKDAECEPPMWGFSSSPLVTRGLVIVHAGDGKGKGELLAYDEPTGELRWSAPSGDHSYSSPQLSTVAGKECVLMVTNKGVEFVEPESGDMLGEHVSAFDGYRVIQPLLLGDSSLLIGTPLTESERIDVTWDGERFTTETAWGSNRLKPYFNDVVAHEGFVYGLDNNILVCIDPADEAGRAWKRGRYGNGQILLLPDNDQLLLTTADGEVVLVRAAPDQWQELARHRVLDGRTWNHPVLVGNRLYVRNGEEAACFELAVDQ